MSALEAAVERIDVAAYRIPTADPESDGTLTWDATTAVVVQAHGGGRIGLGYTYGDASAAGLIRTVLSPAVEGCDALSVPASWSAMVKRVRNIGRPGIASCAVSALDSALWDLKASLLGLPLADLLGRVRPAVPIYGSGGFTSYSVRQLCDQLSGWVERGVPRVKMKVGRDPSQDVTRVHAARAAIGSDAELYVDANGAYDRKQADAKASAFTDAGVSWFEEPVSSDDLHGLRLLRDRAPAGMEVTAGEYGYDLPYFRRMLEAGAVDVLMADATRCGGVTGFLRVAALCEACSVPLSAHTAPGLHLHLGAALEIVRHIEWFHDHVLVERELFDGNADPQSGRLQPDPTRSGFGLTLRADAARYRI